jgi:sialate O-acetylesterase
MKQAKIFLLLSLLLNALITKGQLKTAQLFNNHMVLQRNKPIKIWGWCSPKDQIIVTLHDKEAKTITDLNGKWILTLPAMEAGGPYVLTVKSKIQTLSYKDVMLGEVWLCSGQSNMEWPMKSADGYRTEKKQAEKYAIREFAVPHTLSLLPIDDVGGEWKKSNAQNIGEFSAVAYFFAKELSQQLNVTVGLINASWGGSQAEAWISRETLLNTERFKGYALSMPQTWQNADKRKDDTVKAFAFRNKTPVMYSASALSRESPVFFQNWQKGNAPSSWDWQGKWSSYRGKGFMQKTVILSENETKQESKLRLADKDEYADVYINDKHIFSSILAGSPYITIPAGTWKSGENSLLLHLSTQKDPSWYGPGIGGDKENLHIKFSDTLVNIAGSDWRLMPDFASKYEYEKMNNRVASLLYNALINPIVPYTMQGVIWYQGENNTGRSYEYRNTFPLLINDWRKRWNEVLPFIFVQLSSSGGQQSSNEGSTWAELRESQAMALSLPKTGMAVTIDIGDPNDVHPKNKKDVGKRLAVNAFRQVYGLDIPHSGPSYQSVSFNKDTATLTFAHTYGGLVVKDKYGYLKGFEVSGSDKKWYYAQAIIEKDKVKVWSNDVSLPVAVRYAWTDAPVESNLFNKSGLPAVPFRTDDWQLLSKDWRFE